MKLLILGFYCLVFMAAVHAQSPPPQMDAIDRPFHWKGQSASLLGQVPGTHSVGGDWDGQPDKLSIERNFLFGENLGPGTYILRTLDGPVVAHITTRHYAITGHIVYQNVAAGSFLEMESWFAPQQPGGPELFYFSRTLADAGPMAKIEGSDAGHDFELPFDSTGAKTPLVRLVLKLHLAGAGYLEFSNVRLVQYPDASGAMSGVSPNLDKDVFVLLTQHAGEFHLTMADVNFPSLGAFEVAAKERFVANPNSRFIIRGAEDVEYAHVTEVIDSLCHVGISNISFTTKKGPAAVTKLAAIARQLSGVSPAPYLNLDGQSFWAGVLATIGTICGIVLLFVLGRNFQRLRHKRELRRIASLDG